MLDETATAVLTRNHDVDLADHSAPAASSEIFHAENSDFGLPGWIWRAMFASYGIFFGALMFATGRDGYAILSIVISVLYTVMYFATAGMLQSLGKSGRKSLFERGQGRLATWTGEMGTASVAAQVLTVPVLFAFFAIGIAIMRASLGF